MFGKRQGYLFPNLLWHLSLFQILILTFLCIPESQAQHAVGIEYNPWLHSRQIQTSLSAAHLSVTWKNSTVQDREWAQKWHVRNAVLRAGMFQPGNQINDRFSRRWYVTGGMDFRLVGAGRWSAGLLPSFGIVWLPQQNDVSVADHHLLGSQLNNLFAISPYVEWSVTGDFLISANFRLNHISNGGRVLPNRGINYATGGLGLFYQWNKARHRAPVYSEEQNERFTLSLVSGLGTKAVKDHKQNLWVNNWQVNGQYRPGCRIGWVLAVDYFRSWNVESNKKHDQLYQEKWTGSTLGIASGVRFHFGNLKLIGEAGVYLWKEMDTSRNFYQTVGFEYRLGTRWAAIAYMRLHDFDTADCMVFGFRYDLISR